MRNFSCKDTIDCGWHLLIKRIGEVRLNGAFVFCLEAGKKKKKLISITFFLLLILKENKRKLASEAELF